MEKLRTLNSRGFFTLATIELTSQCNLSCKYCYVKPVDRELTTAQVLDAIDRLADAGVVSVLFTGGEVFLREDFLEILEHSFRRKFFQTIIQSNGTHVRQEHLRFLASHRKFLGYIRFSFFSHVADVHDAFTGVPGSFERSLANAIALNEAGLDMHVVINLIEENVDTISQTKAFFIAKGFNVLEGHVKMISDERTGSCCTPLTTKEFFRRYFAQCPDSIKSVMRKSLEDACGDKQIKELLCEKMFGTIAILAGGDIVPCIAFRDVSVGNITVDRRPLQDILRASPFMHRQKSLRRSDLEPCNTCKFINFCAFCPGMMLAENQSLTIPTMQSCNYARALYEALNT
jgi:radical SAM protein with 4Fe4S-binding SPASM domain